MKSLHALVGHEDVRRSLARARLAEGLPASLLIHGRRGIGKQRLALWIAQLQLCETPDEGGPCGSCRPCRLSSAVEHPDLHWYFPLERPKGVSGDRLGDALESARIDALTDLRANPLRPSHGDELRGLYLALIQGLRRKAQQRPTMSQVQIFLIADAEYLVPQEASPEAANALLKLLEEPPGGTRFVLTSSEPGRLLPTIRSRSVPLHLSPLDPERVCSFLQEEAGVGAEQAEWAARLGQGSIGRALGFLPTEGEPGPLEAMRVEAFRLVEAAMAPGRAPGYAAALAYTASGARRLVALFAFVEEWLADLTAVAVGAEQRVVNRDHLSDLHRLVTSSRMEPGAAAEGIFALEEARELARGNVNPQLIVSGLMRRLRAALRGPKTTTRGA